jgi:hypothetical protein
MGASTAAATAAARDRAADEARGTSRTGSAEAAGLPREEETMHENTPCTSGSEPDEGRLPPDAGMATAEYAIATLAAAGFAGLLLVVLRSDEVRGMLAGIVRQALSL